MRFLCTFVDEAIVLFCERRVFRAGAGDTRNAWFVFLVRRWDDFGMGNFVLIVGMKWFGKFIWRDNERELINIFKYVIKVPCKCMKSAMWRHTSHVQKESTLVEILSTLENA